MGYTQKQTLSLIPKQNRTITEVYHIVDYKTSGYRYLDASRKKTHETKDNMTSSLMTVALLSDRSAAVILRPKSASTILLNESCRRHGTYHDVDADTLT